MSTSIPLLSEAELPPELAARLKSRVERLGYLGDFFRYTAHQPKALMSFLELTEDLKRALPNNLTEVIALSVGVLMNNSYERVQHERLSLTLGYGQEWIRELLSLQAEGEGTLSKQERAVQRLTIAVVTRKGKDCAAELEAVIRAFGPATAIAVLMLIGRYVTHGLIANTLDLTPPVPSPLKQR